MEGMTIQNKEFDRITKKTKAKDNINDLLGIQTGSSKDLDTILKAQLRSGNDDTLHAGEGSKLGHGDVRLKQKELGKRLLQDVGPNDLNFGSVANNYFNFLEHVSALSAAGTIALGLEQPMHANNFDGVKVHFNLTFEGPDEVYVQLAKSIVDLGKAVLVPDFLTYPKSII
ncbi:hypothetical protein J1N35_010759 [Gossypium stocksii]|uniref:Uncharacterized protein n=1 Tax=Gossypium stocksii TaxID=47602 RepID=A0A9D3W103_9ROSI|nr:hypothetical protein J1N35_010759 [Gossypium stocksii]